MGFVRNVEVKGEQYSIPFKGTFFFVLTKRLLQAQAEGLSLKSLTNFGIDRSNNLMEDLKLVSEPQQNKCLSPDDTVEGSIPTNSVMTTLITLN